MVFKIGGIPLQPVKNCKSFRNFLEIFFNKHMRKAFSLDEYEENQRIFFVTAYPTQSNPFARLSPSTLVGVGLSLDLGGKKSSSCGRTVNKTSCLKTKYNWSQHQNISKLKEPFDRFQPTYCVICTIFALRCDSKKISERNLQCDKKLSPSSHQKRKSPSIL